MAQANSTRQQEIRCALTDPQYCDIASRLNNAGSMLQLVRHQEDGRIPDDVHAAVDVAVSEVKLALDLLQRAWDRTREARHG